MINLKEKYGRKYQIFQDISYKYDKTDERRNQWRYDEIRGKYGFIYNYGENQLAVWVTGSHIVAGTKRKHKNWFVKTDGLKEAIFLFPESELKIVADLIKARKRKSLSPDHLAKLRENIKKAHAKKR